MQKYLRFIGSPMARQSGILAGLESFYRNEIPKQKLFDQIASARTCPTSVSGRSIATGMTARPSASSCCVPMHSPTPR